MLHTLSLRFTGFIASLLLSLAAYFVIVNPAYFHMDANEAVLVIFILAIIQSIVQLIFFIDMWKEEGPFWNLLVFLSTASIIFIIIFFSIWIIDNLNYNM